ncbi:MAG: hypothetical protein IKL05_05760 [Clostridia bacterium]|nr:hypothetical protein [Clostridia bacterium]
MKKILLLLLVVTLILTFASCEKEATPTPPDENGEKVSDVVENKDEAPDTTEPEAPSVSVTYEEAKLNSGYICIEEFKSVALKKDGTMVGLNDGYPIPDSVLEECGVNKQDIVKFLCAGYGYDTVALTKDGKTTRITVANDEPCLENVKDIIFSPSYSHDDNIICVMKDGRVLTTIKSLVLDERAYIDGITDAVEATRGADHRSVTVTHADGTVSVWAEGDVLDQINTEQASLLEEISGWTDIVLAHGNSGNTYLGGENYFYVGLKKDGTVVATGSYAELVKDWKNIAYIDTGYGVIAGLTTDGRVLVVGECSGEASYDGVSPTEWENVVGISVSTEGRMLGLTNDGTVIGHWRGSEGENGFGPF